MRALPAALLASAVVHTGALAWVCAHRAEAARRVEPRRAVSVAVATPPAPAAPDMAVVLLDGDTVKPPPAASPAMPAPPAAPGRRAVPAHAAIATGRPQAPEVASPSQPSQAPKRPEPPARHSSYMDMRPPPLTGLHFTDAEADQLLAKSQPPARPDNPRDAIQADLAHARDELNNPGWIANASPGAVAAARQQLVDGQAAADGEELHPSGHGTYKSSHLTFTGHVNADGTASVRDTPDVGDFHMAHWDVDGVQVPLPLIVGKVDFDDWIMHKKGIDPYAAAKLAWLDQTRDERVAIGRAHRKEVLAHAPEYMQQNLAWLWAKVQDPAKRRRALFELWDECAETGDDDLVKAGAAARAYVLGFIRTHLPAGSPDAFTPDELARLNAHRLSHVPFAPYGAAATP